MALSDYNQLIKPHFLRCYLKKMHLASDAITASNTIVSLTTTPIRIQKIWPTLNSILLQSVKPEKIYLWIPKKYKRFPNKTIHTLPAFILNNPLIHAEFIDTDYGPGTKLLPCLKTAALHDKKIIVIDDDRIYPRHLIKLFLHYEQLNPSSAIGISGRIVSKDAMYNPIYCLNKTEITLVDILLGYNAYLIKPIFFSTDVFNYPVNLASAFFEDDVWISGNLQKRGIRRLIIKSKPSEQNILLDNKKTSGLHSIENADYKNFYSVFNYFNQFIGSTFFIYLIMNTDVSTLLMRAA